MRNSAGIFDGVRAFPAGNPLPLRQFRETHPARTTLGIGINSYIKMLAPDGRSVEKDRDSSFGPVTFHNLFTNNDLGVF